jgi:UDP-N-acetylglucosamine acyltransferase
MSIKIGENNKIHNTVIIGERPQDLKDVSSNIKDKSIWIGESNTIREYVCIHLPMNNLTHIGSNNYIMTHCTISHDCIINHNCIISTNTCLGGHSILLSAVNLGINTCLHPFVVCGSFSMIGMGSVVTKHIPPFCLYNPKYGIRKINIIGMNRSKLFSEDDIKNVIDFYNYIDNDWVVRIKNYKNICNKIITPYITDFINNLNSNRKIEIVKMNNLLT